MAAEDLERIVLKLWSLRSNGRFDLRGGFCRLALKLFLSRRVSIVAPGGMSATIANTTVGVDVGR